MRSLSTSGAIGPKAWFGASCALACVPLLPSPSPYSPPPTFSVWWLLVFKKQSGFIHSRLQGGGGRLGMKCISYLLVTATLQTVLVMSGKPLSHPRCKQIVNKKNGNLISIGGRTIITKYRLPLASASLFFNLLAHPACSTT